MSTVAMRKLSQMASRGTATSKCIWKDEDTPKASQTDRRRPSEEWQTIHGDLIKVPPSELNAMSSPWPFIAWGMDVIGPIEPAASNGHRFILVAIGVFTKWVEATKRSAKEGPDHCEIRHPEHMSNHEGYERLVVTRTLAKSDVFENFKNWKILIENQCDRKIKCLQTNNGLEFCNEEFDNFCKIHGVLRYRTVRHTPQQNRVAERMNHTLLEKARCMLSNAKVPKEFWVEVVNTACYVVNHSSASAIDFKTPNEVWSDVTFDKASMLDPGKTSIEFTGQKVLTTETAEENMKLTEQKDQVTQVESDNEKAHTVVPEGEPYSIATGRDKRTSKLNLKYYPQPSQANLVAYALATAEEEIKDLELLSYTKATMCGEDDQWSLAMTEEIKKDSIPGVEDTRYKARLVAKGFCQKEGIDYNEIFSPVVKHSSVRLFLALAAYYDLKLHQLDVKTVFLHGELEEVIFMNQPEGFLIEGKEDQVCQLNKSLYGLKQSPR
ncbi:uncharacterized protein LOC132637677 [Lycium barbarum]|uniref:uncharacterized protein LOC132637677 n=1 Tax=Lycium barbarum TaxID=112863 RepID=UPI00293ED542|nr:uncharacterized protein LOC132637677 [Lycium barbarum]